MEESEEWKSIEGHEGLYEVSNFGRVKSLKRIVKNSGIHDSAIRKEKILKNSVTKRGYLSVTLCYRTLRKTKLTHRLVALAFIPNPENKPEVNHKDSDRTNSHFKNLEWCTSLENSEHCTNYGYGKNRALNSSQSKVTPEIVKEIRKLYSDGLTQKEISYRFKISRSTVGSIVTFKSWKYIK